MGRLFALTLALGGLLACESGTAETHTFTLTQSTTDAFSPESPGLLRVEPGIARVLCGDAVQDPFAVYFDFGFGCLDDELKGTEVSRTAWVEPVPEGFDTAALCALPVQERQPVTLTSEITGEGYVGSVAPEEGWLQSTSTGKWKRASVCGGHLKVEHTL